MWTEDVLKLTTSAVRTSARLAGWAARRLLKRPEEPAEAAPQHPPIPKTDMDDITLARKVETVIFRANRSVKPTVSVNAVDGVVWLRGEVEHPEQVHELERDALAVPEVRGVENLLHLPKTPAPTRADTPRRQQRTRSSTRQPRPRATSGRVTDDRTDDLVPGAEPSPVEHAAQREGRTAAPLGAQETVEESSQESSGVATDPGVTPGISSS